MNSTKTTDREKASRPALTDKARWTVIMGEIAACYLLIYLSVYLKWPGHEYFRFTVLIPLFQAGVAFGFTGGIIGGIVVSLLFIPIIPKDPAIWKQPLGIPGAVALLVFLNLFGIFVGGAIGHTRKTQAHLDRLSRMFLNIAKESTERDIMSRLAREAGGLLESGRAAFLVRKRGEGPTGGFEMAALGADGDFDCGTEFSPAHPLVKAAECRSPFATNSLASDPRFKPLPGGCDLKSLLVVPVCFENESYGALLLGDKKNDELYAEKDITLAMLLAGMAATAIHNLARERERQEQKLREDQMKELFSRYVSSSVADFVLGNPELLKGRWREVTVLVSDIRDFTRISDGLPPRKVVEQLNEYFTRMVDVIFENNGTIDKFVGDCIIAYWGAPAPDPEHALHAARTAVRMAAAQKELNKTWEALGRQPFNSGIAVHTCSVLMGTLGDDRKKSFTIAGEAIGKAMKIESLTKTTGAEIIVSARTADAVSAAFTLKRLDMPDPGGDLGGLFELMQE